MLLLLNTLGLNTLGLNEIFVENAIKGYNDMRADKEDTIKLIKTAKGQLEGVLKMIEEDRYCVDISHQLLAVSAVIKKANKLIIKGHIEGCVKEALESGSEERKEEMLEEVYGLMDDLSR